MRRITFAFYFIFILRSLHLHWISSVDIYGVEDQSFVDVDIIFNENENEDEQQHITFDNLEDEHPGKRIHDEVICPSNHVFVQDKILPMNVTHANRYIPRVIHFFVKSKCLPHDVALNIKQWMALDNHAILLHDHNEITEYLSKERIDLPFIPKALHCAFQHETILDLARLVWLHDHGGISVDIDHIPGDGFANGTLLDPDAHGTTRHFLIDDHPYPRFIASEPKHFAIYGTLLLSIAMQYRQHVFNSTAYANYTDMRNEIYSHTVNYEFMGRDYKQVITTLRSKERTGISLAGRVNTKRTAGNFLLQTSLPDESLASTRLTIDKDVEKCVDLEDDSYDIDTDTLIDIIGGIPDNEMNNESCPDDQVFIRNTYIPNSFLETNRNIPKVVHMTSKSKCFTKPYAKNADLWRFEDYSFFLHDDAAVERLFHHSKWPEFPLLKELLPCLTSGAMKADYWRYLITWKFGGLYTDMDNAPGIMFKNGTIITDMVDAFFEVERSEVASQYFFAVSPHHPLAYFMMSATIERIIMMARELDRARQAAEITGPAAVKVAMMATIGNGYPAEGNYVGTSNRSVTVVGDKRTAKQGKYLIRQSVESFLDELKKMNMTHYKTRGESNGKADHSCQREMKNMAPQIELG